MKKSINKSILDSLKVFAMASILSISTMYAYAAWTNPPASPPSGNTPTPLNVGAVDQTKAGSIRSTSGLITDGGLWVTGGALIGGNTGIGGELTVTNGKGITLGGVRRTTWPDGGGATDVVTVQGNLVTNDNPGEVAASTATCPAGKQVVGGGYAFGGNACGDSQRRFQRASQPVGDTQWMVIVECSTVRAIARCI
ncbi:hypothetical protein H6787_00655 [Candidatus Nomurabacteria bacterium]|nr:hypothetical protein [Candidatus Nomurabacteria bacterium]